MGKLLTESEARDIVGTYSKAVTTGSPFARIVDDLRPDYKCLERAVIYSGKVSDSLTGPNLYVEDIQDESRIPLRIMHRSSGISTHDVKRGEVPFKDQVLAINHDYMHNLTKDVLGNSQLEIPGLEPTSTLIVAEDIDMLDLEMVNRWFMAESSTSTSLYQHYMAGGREFCGHKLPDGLKANDRLPYLMDTPSTKGKHDRSVAPEELYALGICTPDQYKEIRNASQMAYGMVYEDLIKKGVVFVDTKTEHGIDHMGRIVAGDEKYTMDSSRYWLLMADGSLVKDNSGKPVSFSKQFARDMIKDEATQQYTTEQANEIGVRYVMGLQHLTGQRFEPDTRPRDERLEDSMRLTLDSLGLD